MGMQETAQRWWDRVEDPELKAEIAALLAVGSDALQDAFFQELSFGTAGLRGVIGAGTNRMNVYTVGRATQGLANYLLRTYDHPTVAIARDSRNKGAEFVERAACVLAANGVRVFVYPRIEPVPALSFAVRDLACSAGICMTASHNPKEYNGYKVYGPDGCQITDAAAGAISAEIASVDLFDDVKSMPIAAAREAGLVLDVPEEVLDRFMAAELASDQTAEAVASVPLSVVYTPLNGSGLELAKRLFDALGVQDVAVVPEQENPDGDFPTCPYPNPETREAMQKGIELMAELHPDLLIATDPDADRVGIAVEDEGGTVLLTGNEVGVLMLDYLCRTRREGRGMPAGAQVVSTIVSTTMVDALAAGNGIEVRRTLTGFKYIGEIISALVDAGHPERFLLGFEESYGYLAATHVRDKDAISAMLVICQMARFWKSRGMNLAQAMRALYDEYGWYKNKTLSVSFPGASGASRMRAIMTGLRTAAPAEIAGLRVVKVADYQLGLDGLPRADVLEFELENCAKVIIRPSGTEPKVKGYLFAKAESDEAAAATIASLEHAVSELLA